MNILFVTGAFAKDKRDMALGGMAKAVYTSAKGMKKRGHSVKILTVDSRSYRWSYDGIEVISVQGETPTTEKKIHNILFQICQREYNIEKAIRKENKEKKIDMIQYTGWFGIGLFHFTRIPSVMRVSTYSKLQLNRNYSKIKVMVFGIIEYLATIRMNLIFAPSNVIAEKMGKDIGRKILVIETPYTREDIKWESVKEVENKKYLLFFGRPSAEKGIYPMKEILYKLLKNNPDLYIVFLGNVITNDGKSMKAELLKEAKEFRKQVICLKTLPQKNIKYLLNHAYAVLIPSILDNFPNSCAEAMDMGKIVIGTDGSSLEQFITDGYNGYLARVDDSESLYKKIEQVINLDDEEREYICVNAKKRIEKLNMDNYSKKMENIYQQVINNN